MVALWLIPIVLALLFAYVDVWYFARLIVLRLRIAINSRSQSRGKLKGQALHEAIFAPYDLNGIVLLSDIDFMLHMNNSKYMREMDYGRIGMGMERGLHRALRKNKAYMVMAASSIRYRRSLGLFQRFVLRTRILCWDEGAFYVEQRMLQRDGFVSAIMLAKMAVCGIAVSSLIKYMTRESVESPPFPPEVARWCESITASSRSLRKERQQTTN